MRRRDLIGAALAIAVPSAAWAHPMPNSTVFVEVLPGSVRLTVSIPLSEMAAALSAPADGAEAFKAQMLGYLSAHASILGADGQPWTPELQDMASAHGRQGEHPVMAALLVFTPPPGTSTRAKTLRYDAVNHRVASHYVLVYRLVGEKQVPLGRLQSPTTELQLP